ncbi:MAG: AAA domain-containing protein, partial [Saprospiraceae bacterium]
MPNSHSNLIAYFKSCYQEDTRDVQLMNFFGQKVENRLMLEDFDLISGKSLLYPVPTDWGKKAQAELAIHGKEKGLYAFSMFLVGNGSVAGRKQKVVAPLLLHPLELSERDEVFYLSFKGMENNKSHELIVNPFISRLAKSENDTKKVLNNLYAELANDFIKFEQCNEIHDIIQANFNEIDTSELLAFPKVYDDKKILELVDFQKNGKFVLVPGCGVGFMQKSKYSRGILNELDDLINAEALSEPLVSLFKQKVEIKKTDDDEPIFAPRLLSHSQAQVCRSAHTNSVTLVQGPPGTGKSYTIAAIAADAVARGESVLIASKSDQAIQVVATKIEEDMELKNLPILASRSNYLEEAKVQVKKLLSQRQRYAGLNRLDLIEYRLVQINRDIEDIEQEYI